MCSSRGVWPGLWSAEVGGSRAKSGQRVDKFRWVEWRGRRNRTFRLDVDCGWEQEAETSRAE